MVGIPGRLSAAIDALDCDHFRLGSVRDHPTTELEAGALAHLGVTARDGRVDAPKSVLPPASRGRHSVWNLDGREIVRKDLPKQPRSFVVWVYPYGDTSRSKVAAYQTRLAYPRQRLHGHGDRLLVDVNATSTGLARVGVRVDRVFDKVTYGDDPELALAAGLLRENAGAPTPVCSDTTAAQWTAYREVGWEILPPGLRGPALVAEVTRRLGMRADDPRTRVAEQRLQVVMALRPTDVYIRGRTLRPVRGLRLPRRPRRPREPVVRQRRLRHVRELARPQPAQPTLPARRPDSGLHPDRAHRRLDRGPARGRGIVTPTPATRTLTRQRENPAAL